MDGGRCELNESSARGREERNGIIFFDFVLYFGIL